MAGILALITARGGSKGVPGKNIARVGGKPLIAWTIEAAQQAANSLGHKSEEWTIDRVVVSTDSPEIRETCLRHGAQAPFLRPAQLAKDDSSHFDTVRHALDWLAEHQQYRPQWILLLQPTSPLRTARDICGAIAAVRAQRAPAVVSVSQTHDHPFLVRAMNTDGTLREFVPCTLAYPRRQDLPVAYALNGAIYVTRRDVLLEEKTFEPRGTIAHVMPTERSLQVDTPWDMRLLDLIIRNREPCHMTDAAADEAAHDQGTEWHDAFELHRVSEK